jgi:hypothetical protein
MNKIKTHQWSMNFLVLTFLFCLFESAIASETETTSNGGLFIEPGLSFEKGDAVVNYPPIFGKSSGTINGFGLSAKVGFHFSELFFIGVDGRFAMPTYKDSSLGYDATALSHNWGPIVGFQMPHQGLRVWGTYVMGGEFDPKKDGALDVKFDEASGFRLGAGMRAALVSLNLEYQELKYDRAVLEQLGPFTGNSNFGGVRMENKTWVASVSMPVEL